MNRYECPECKSIIEIQDNEFQVKKVYKYFKGHTFVGMGLSDFQEDTRTKIRVCDCPVCGATIFKESNYERI